MEGAERHQGLSLIPEEKDEEEKSEFELRDPIQELKDRARGDAAKPAAVEGPSSTSTSESEAAAAEGSRPLVRKCRKLLYRSMKVGVEDGRVFKGIFHCLDKQGNIILHSTVEYRDISSSGGPNRRDGGESSGGPPVIEERPLGLVLIPARCRTSCYVECSLDEQMDLLSLDS